MNKSMRKFLYDVTVIMREYSPINTAINASNTTQEIARIEDETFMTQRGGKL